ncbi:Protein CBG06415 [Caenorhabditis briggsae]|uniref:Protein CBG06415 n=1 Tax=Caenorhabditis briggsae TaxID=6238 RepID=A8X264_CAEBR|nr:Protein CBG06415 [Caenorhabditis briggsae]CAP26724.1 Protein CBG06415 [Caenorhabditis briggsae]
MDSRLTNLYVAAIYKVILCIFGIVGNLMFIHLIYRRKQLQSRTSIFQCIQCFFHIFCSIGTVQYGVIDIGDTHIRSECFNQISYYVFFQAAQGLLMLVIVMDIWFFVKFPIVYRNISKTKSIIFSGITILTFSIFTTLYGFFTTNDDTIYSCSPPFAFGPKAGVLYKYLFIGLACSFSAYPIATHSTSPCSKAKSIEINFVVCGVYENPRLLGECSNLNNRQLYSTGKVVYKFKFV